MSHDRQTDFVAIVRNFFSIILLSALLLPLIYTLWVSFTPGKLLEPPTQEWSLRWYQTFFTNFRWTQGLAHSLVVASLTALFSLLAGGGVALAVTRYRFPGSRLLSEAVLLPLYIPAVVLAMALLPFMRSIGLWGSIFCIVAAHTLGSLPIVFLVIRSALQEFDLNLEQAAHGLGAGLGTTLRRVTLPGISSALLVGGIIAFILSLNEFIMAFFLGTAETETLPKVIWPNLRYTLSPLVASAAVITLVITLAGLGLVIRLLKVDRIAKQI